MVSDRALPCRLQRAAPAGQRGVRPEYSWTLGERKYAHQVIARIHRQGLSVGVCGSGLGGKGLGDRFQFSLPVDQKKIG